MIAAQRQDILRLLQRLSELTPDVRFGQLIANLSYLALGPTNEAIWDMEDEQLLVALRKHITDLSDRAAHVALAAKPAMPAQSGERSSLGQFADHTVGPWGPKKRSLVPWVVAATSCGLVGCARISSMRPRNGGDTWLARWQCLASVVMRAAARGQRKSLQ